MAEPSKTTPCVDAERPSPRRAPEVLADEDGEMLSSTEQGVVSVLSCAKRMSGVGAQDSYLCSRIKDLPITIANR